MRKLIILGAGGHGKVVADAAESQGAWASISFLDDRAGEMSGCLVWPVVGKLLDFSSLLGDYTDFVVAIGSNEARLKWAKKIVEYNGTLATVLHPRAYVSRHAEIGPGTVCLAQSIVNPAAIIGANCIINSGACIEHDCILEDAVHICPNATLAGGVIVEQCCTVGAGSVIKPMIRIGKNAYIGAGSAVVKDIPGDCIALGVPARPLKSN
ncbi:acetyltransferase [Chitiniphilus shinanonensis]|uniref:acetyltransferase n=1 Tax=Chitiniphilus shinanonensis TaxID=553088 RepID=UPI0033406AD9